MVSDDLGEPAELDVGQRADELLGLAAGLMRECKGDLEGEGVYVGHSGLRLLMSPDASS